MTKQTIISNLKNISDSYRADDNNNSTLFYINNMVEFFFVKIAVETHFSGSIFCDCIRIDNDSDLINFINNGKIISIFSCTFIDEILRR